MWHTTWKNGLKCRNLTLMEVGQKVCRLPITIPFQDLIQSSSDRVTAFVGQQESRDIKIAHVCRYAQKNNGISYTVVLYVASIRHIWVPYRDNSLRCHCVWWANTSDPSSTSLHKQHNRICCNCHFTVILQWVPVCVIQLTLATYQMSTPHICKHTA